MTALLESFARAGVLSRLDVHLAMSMGRLGEFVRIQGVRPGSSADL